MTRFDALQLSSEVQQGLQAMGFEEASPIQAESIPLLLNGRDFIGQAQTGTGKTAAFAIPVIEMVDAKFRQPQALVICPTRELAVQVANEFRKILKFRPDMQVAALYGGESLNKQFKVLAKNPQIIVGTPGRLLDLYRRGSLRMKHICKVVLDEADEMLDMGFRDDLEAILDGTRNQKQTVMFSATMSKPILELANRYLINPQFVAVKQPAQKELKIDQVYFELGSKQKLGALTYLIDQQKLKLALVFCNTKRQVDDLVMRMQKQGYAADGLHGGLTQSRRDRVMNGFRRGAVQFLIATDVAARGIDVNDIEAVINYDLPKDPENYIHRIGRTGRAGKSGRAYTFVDARDFHMFKKIQRITRSNAVRETIPA